MKTIEEYLNHYLDYDARIAAFNRGKQFSVEFELTSQCCFSCNYCYAHANIEAKVLSPDLVVALLRRLKDYGIGEVGWIGGEPLLYEALSDCVRVAKGLGLKQALYTNGALLDRFADLSIFDRITFHVDSLDYSVWSAGQERPSPKMFLSMIRNIESLPSRYDMRKVVLSIPLTRATFRTLRETLLWARNLGIGYVNTIPLNPMGCEDRQEDFISREDIWEAMRMRAEVLGMPFLLNMGITEYGKIFQMTDFAVKYTGEIVPYIDSPIILGNIHNDDLIDVLVDRWKDFLIGDWVSTSPVGAGEAIPNKASTCASCQYGKQCFGNPVSYSKSGPSFDEVAFDCVWAHHE